MQNSISFRDFLNRNFYLLIAAAWLITFAIIIDNYWSPNASLGKVRSRLTTYIQNSERDFEKLNLDTEFIKASSGGSYSEKFIKQLSAKPYFIFSYNIDTSGQYQLSLWNTQQVTPSTGLLYLNGNSGFVQLQNAYYVWNSFSKNNIKSIALIPVKWNYIVENEYLKNRFALSHISDEYDLSFKDTEASVTSIYGNKLFDVQQQREELIHRNNILAVWLVIGAFCLIFFFIHLVCAYISLHYGSWIGISLLFAVLLIVRIISYYDWLPINFRQFELYDPSIYSSSMILRSLGDLLVNALFFVWFILFLRSQVQHHHMRFLKRNKFLHIPVLIFGCAIILASSYIGSYVVRSLVSDSKISFDVINFFTLNVYSVVGFIILCCTAIGYFFLCQVIVHFINPFFKKSTLVILFTLTVIGLLMLTFRVGRINSSIDFHILVWILFFVFLLNTDTLYLLASRLISSRLVFWLFFFSVSITSIIVRENTFKELENRKHFATKLAIKADPSSQVLLNSMLLDFRDDFLTRNFSRFRSADSDFFKDSLVDNNTAGYSDRFDTKIYSYDADETPLSNPDSTSFNELNTIYNTQAKATDVPNLLYYDLSYDRYNYISRKHLRDTSGTTLGYVFILVSAKRDKDDALYPELFGRGRENSIENSSIYAFAIYNNWKLIDSHNDYAFATSIRKENFPPQEFHIDTKDRYTELWHNAGNGRLVVIAKKNSLSLESITLFSYLFCAFLVLTSIFWFINILLSARFHYKKLKQYWQFNIRNQIHGTIIFISVVSFLVIGIATILFFIRRYEMNNREQLSRAIHIMEKEVKSYITNEWDRSDTLTMSDHESRQTIEIIINRISEIHGADVNLYDLKGNLRVSSLPFPYIKGIISTVMNPVAFYHLNTNNEIQYFQKEHIGELEYVSNYIPVIDNNGDKYAYLNIPYFISESRLKSEISNFLVTIINLNAFIFLVAGIVALFITNRITSSFLIISEKMKKVNLGTRNEAIVWTRRDEIGDLVNEYNKMVAKLEESAAALARTERESAWREMAKQIAHEIKNPLTPMKLSMQYLQKSIEQNHPNIQELTAGVSRTLVEQIDHLSHIASEFSQFANIENSRKELVDINMELNNVLDLYRSDPRLQLNTSILDREIIIHADKTHMNRVFNNLLQNALQASDDVKAIVTVQEILQDDNVLISIRDNGTGIKEDVRDKIFTPNFTTKTSGTGLGLAMSRRMVEHANGKIWFETTDGEGTVFFLQFPLAK